MRYISYFLFSAFFSISIQAQTPAHGNIYAVIIGISKYLEPDIQQLQFADRDAEVFADFLQSKAGGSVPKENISLFTDSTATSAAVYNAVYWLTKTCKKDDLVFFYFSGHGGLENVTDFHDAYLICYNSPPENFVGFAFSVEYLNKIANTLSANTGAKVVLITDACHSGKITDDQYKKNVLIGEKLMATNEKEIRMASSTAEQLSNEKIAWGGGRGVFSYYLVNGLQGPADKNNDGVVTLGEIKIYLETSLADDPVLKQEKKTQTPVLKGNESFALSTVDKVVMLAARSLVVKDSANNVARDTGDIEDELSAEPDDLFIDLLKNESLEALTDSLHLAELSSDQIAFALLKFVKDSKYLPIDREHKKLTDFENSLQKDKESLNRFKGRLATAFDNKGQEVILQYLKGDEAELERRRYYNIYSSGYDVYPRMFTIALKLIQPDDYFTKNILEVKLHYFTGVNLRLKIPLFENPAALIEQALSEQKKALAIEKHAAYIYNELGVLYSYKNNDAEAEKYFITASNKASTWAIPLLNLADLYADEGQLEKALLYSDSAKKLQPGFREILMSYGLIYEKQGKLLQSKEVFHKSIKLNSRHFLPFERLGYLYMNTARYADADSMFYEAAQRKKGFHFSESGSPRHMKLPKPLIEQVECNIDQSNVTDNDIIGHFALGYLAYRDYSYSIAETEFKKVIALDKNNPLAYHYLGMVLAENKRWQEAEIIIKLALERHVAYEQFIKYLDSVAITSTQNSPDASCIDSSFRYGYYDLKDDYLLLAAVYENWNHYQDAETYYRKAINADSSKSSTYLQLAALLKRTGRFNEAERLLYENYNEEALTDFYKEVTAMFPDNADWLIKAGNFEYRLAKNNPERFLFDKKMIDPKSGDLVYVETSEVWVGRQPKDILPRLPLYGYHPHVWPTQFISGLLPFSDGISYLMRAAELQSLNKQVTADIYSKIADLYGWQGLPDLAIPFYEKALTLIPEDAGTRINLVNSYTLTSRFTDAVAQLNILSENNTLGIDKQLQLAGYDMEDGRFADAEKLLNDAEIKYPFINDNVTELKGNLAMYSKNSKLALATYQKLIETNGNDSTVLYNIARLYALSGNTGLAWKWLDLAIAAGFNFSFVLKYDSWLVKLHKNKKWKTLLTDLKQKEYADEDEPLQ